MPQLLPDPWFITFVYSWIILIWLTPKKILTYIFLSEPTSKTSKISKPTWTWPW